MRVGIAGGGIGGLALAQGLRRRGIDTVVFERDARAGDTAGYRLHLPHQALVALRELLPGPLVTAIEGTVAAPETLRQIAVLDHRGRTPARIRLPAGHRLLIGRRPLRELLARGLGDVVRWRTRVVSVPEKAASVVVGVEGGPDVEVDVLVGADGIRSGVTRQVTGRPASRPSRIVAIGGTPTGPVRRPADLRRGIALAAGPRGTGVFLAEHEPRGGVPLPGVIVEDPYGSGRWPRRSPASPPTSPRWVPRRCSARRGRCSRGGRPALQRYRRRLLAYAPAAVREAEPALDWQRRLGIRCCASRRWRWACRWRTRPCG